MSFHKVECASTNFTKCKSGLTHLCPERNMVLTKRLKITNRSLGDSEGEHNKNFAICCVAPKQTPNTRSDARVVANVDGWLVDLG